MPTLRQLILEETCPFCGGSKAYVGLNDVECPNRKCKAFSQRQADDVRPAGHDMDALRQELGKDGLLFYLDEEELLQIAKRFGAIAWDSSGGGTDDPWITVLRPDGSHEDFEGPELGDDVTPEHVEALRAFLTLNKVKAVRFTGDDGPNAVLTPEEYLDSIHVGP